MSQYHTNNYYPVITNVEYPAFLALGVSGIPATYDGWISQQRQSNMERERVGERPVPVPVTARQFKEFCDQRGQGYVGQWLLHYAIEHGTLR
ncbi:MAG TPA: hypothetical protein VFB13_17480 [Reyranella sp.]|jgi:hypothetical protein|nr:hypothetical protein [Reyranella sp.]